MTTSQALNFPVPSTLGSLESYIQTVNRFPLLTAEQELDLGRRLKDTEDIEAARQLVLSHLRVVVSIARGYLGYGLPHADLIQEGNIGLMKAVRRFDPDRGVRLVSFAIHWIRAENHEFILRNWRLVKIATTKAQRKLFFNLRSMKPGFEQLTQAEIKEIAAKLNVNSADVIEMETRLGGHDIALEPQSDQDEETYAPIAYLTDADAEPMHILEQNQNERTNHDGLQQALASLDNRSRQIIEARWLKEDESATLHELAAQHGVSAERIRQIEQKAMQKIKAQLGA